MKQKIQNLDDLIASNFFDCFRGDKLGNNLSLSHPERADRISEAASEGSDGSTHAEHIDDWRECNSLAEREIYAPMFDELGFGEAASDLAAALANCIGMEIDEREQFHAKQGTLSGKGLLGC